MKSIRTTGGESCDDSPCTRQPESHMSEWCMRQTEKKTNGKADAEASALRLSPDKSGNEKGQTAKPKKERKYKVAITNEATELNRFDYRGRGLGTRGAFRL